MSDALTDAGAEEAAVATRQYAPRALMPLVPYVLRYKARIAAALVFLTLAAAATLTVPYAVRQMIDNGFTGQSPGAVNAYFSAMVAVVAVLAVASGGRFYFVTTLGERVVADLRSDVFRHLTTLDASFYDQARTGELLSRLTADTTQLKATFGTSASVALRNFFMFVGAISLMITTSPKLSALVLVAIPIYCAPSIFLKPANAGCGSFVGTNVRHFFAPQVTAQKAKHFGAKFATFFTLPKCICHKRRCSLKVSRRAKSTKIWPTFRLIKMKSH